MQIVVNGVEKALQVEGQFLTYAGLLVLAGKDPDRTLTVTWATATEQGSVARGQQVQVFDGMVFNVVETGAA